MGGNSITTTSKKPTFFKVLIAADFDQKLRICPDFIEHFHGKIPSKSILEGPNGKSWPIQVKRIDNDLCFYDGWEFFVKFNSLEFGDFLVFKYCGNSKFKVKIYGKNGCEKNANLNHEEQQKQETSGDEEEECELNRIYRLHYVSKRREVSKAEENRALELAKRASATCKNPHFLKVMKPSYVSHSFYIGIPKSMLEYLPRKNEEVILSLGGKRWPVNYFYNKIRSNSKISGSGWAKFILENNLEVGDVCLFESSTQKQRKSVLNIRIFRVVEEEIVPLKIVRVGKKEN